MKKFNLSVLASAIALNIIFAFGVGCQIKAPPQTAQPEINYLKKDLLPQFTAAIPDFPKESSDEQRFDELELRRQQKLRTNKDCERAESEVKVTLQNFYGKPYGELDEKQIELLNPFFEKIRSEAGPYIGQIKNAFNRQRPYMYLKNLTPCLPKETSLAYPSGHAILAGLYADILVELYPTKAKQIRQRQQQLGQDRILGGVHHPTDVKSGMILGSKIFNEMQKSENFKTDLEKTRKLIQ